MNELLLNLNKLHTTPLGIERIKRNLKIDNDDIVLYLKNIIKDKNSLISKQGKNYYVKNNEIIITINFLIIIITSIYNNIISLNTTYTNKKYPYQ